MLRCSGVVITPCLCKNPIPDVFWMYPQCSICGRIQAIIAAVFCVKCKGRMNPDDIPEEIKQQEVRCKHSDIEKKITYIDKGR
jgi:hypothetical protein